MTIRYFAIISLVFLFFTVPVLAEQAQNYTINYKISLHQDSSASWTIEYLLPLQSTADQEQFEQNTNSSPILSEESIRQLMEQSAAESSLSTGRLMDIQDFSRASTIQSSPMGTYGVIRFSFLWTNFTQTDGGLIMGDVFPGGLYLPSGASLIIEVPWGYSVASIEPTPDSVNGNLIWYGPDSFDPGQPSVTLTPIAFLSLPILLTGACGAVALATGAVLAWRRRQKKGAEVEIPVDTRKVTTQKRTTEEPPNAELRELEERILNLLDAMGGEMYQSAIIEKLSLPKSTISIALNGLHARRLILKVKKGRENLIRLVKP